MVRRVGVAAALLLGSACQAGEDGPDIQPAPDAAPKLIEATTTTTAVITVEPSTTVLTESPPPLIEAPVQDPILCEGYFHPLHHLPCDEANEKSAAREAPAYSATPPLTRRQPASVTRNGLTPPSYISDCESGGDPTAVNPSSGAGGKWQFMPGTWQSVGGEGRPQDASEAEQDHRAAILWDGGSGASHWDCA